MDDYADHAGRLLAERYRLPRPPAESYHLTESVAYDTASGQEVLVRQVPLPEVVEAEFVDSAAGGANGVAGVAGGPGGSSGGPDAVRGGPFRSSVGRATRLPADPTVRRAVEAAVAAARIPDHPRLDQVFDVFVEGDGLWIVSELLPATPLASLLAEQSLSAHRAAEIAADLLTALRAVHAHGWTHRNITARTVLICDDGRALLTGLAVGAAEEALCGYSPFPEAGRAPVPPSGAIAGVTDGAGVAGVAGEPGRGGGGAGQDGPAAGRSPATWTGSALPAGFDAQREEGQNGGPYADDRPYEQSQPYEQGSELGGDQGQRGIFGFQGLPPDEDGTEEAGHPWHGAAAGQAESHGAPVRHGYETSGPGPRRGAIAAYRAGARRAAEVRGDRAAPDLPTTDDPGTGAGTGMGMGMGVEHRAVPDDYVRWLPPGDDEVSPTDLPGARPANSLPVQATWRPAEPEPAPEHEHELAEPDFDQGPYEDSPDDERPYDDDDPDSQPWGVSDPGEAGGPGDLGEERYRGPTTALAAERARQARMTLVGPVTERWAPEQAGPVYENWRLAPPVGPAADLWALGVLLFRAVQGHAPYPEEGVAELVQMVCGEPPAFAEDCGPLRPVVESLMRQDPTERPDFEELRGWLRSLVRSAPEPEVGRHTVLSPPSLDPGRSADPRRLPILRRRGELVRRRRAEKRPPPAERHRHKRDRRERGGRTEKQQRSPHSLGRWFLGLVLLGLVAVVLYAMWFLPKGGSDGAANQQRGSVGQASEPPAQPGDAGKDQGSGKGGGSGKEKPKPKPKPETPGSAEQVPKGYKLSKDPAGFQVAVPAAWNRRSTTGHGQVRYNGGEVEMVIVDGRDSTKKYGKDPMAYQSDDEPELAAYRASDWASTSGLRRIDVGATAMAEGTFSWRDGGREVYARNRAMILHGRYHLLMVMGSESKKEEIDRHFEAVADTYRATS